MELECSVLKVEEYKNKVLSTKEGNNKHLPLIYKMDIINMFFNCLYL